jgi:hypothetical protein
MAKYYLGKPWFEIYLFILHLQVLLEYEKHKTNNGKFKGTASTMVEQNACEKKVQFYINKSYLISLDNLKRTIPSDLN